MNASLKLGLYALTLLGTLVCGVLFSRTWRDLNSSDAPPVVATKKRPSPSPSPASERSRPTSSTNQVGAEIGADSTTNAPSPDEATNLLAEVQDPASDPTRATAESAPERDISSASEPVSSVQVTGRGWSRLLLWGFLGIASVAGLGSLIAYDVSQYAGNRATLSLFDDEGEGIPDSIDDLVEKAHGDGDFLEAVRLLRAHLGKHPRAVEAQIRIAELYEKDLNNPLAAALEYEEILQKPLAPEKRGWTSIHLVNLYNRLGKPEQAVSWLQRVVTECPGTPAANKARERLESAGLEIPEASPHSRQGQDPSDSEPPSNLPPGFRPRNG